MTDKTGMHRTTLVKKKNLDHFCRTLLKKTLFLMSFKFFVNLVSRISPDLMAEGAERLSGENSEDPTGTTLKLDAARCFLRREFLMHKHLKVRTERNRMIN